MERTKLFTLALGLLDQEASGRYHCNDRYHVFGLYNIYRDALNE